MKYLFLACGLLLLPVAAHGQQKNFNLSYIEDSARYAYTWEGLNRQVYDLNFSVPIPLLQASMTDFTAFESFEANQIIAQRVEAKAKQLFPDVDFTMTAMPGGIKYSASADKAKAEAAMKKVQEIEREVRDAYIAERYYTYAKENVLMPDHARIASIYSQKVQPLAQGLLQELPQGASARDVMNLALGFFQTIPYNTLKDRYTSSGAGFETPLRMLAENRGDCDTKSVGYLSVLRHYYPDLALLMVYTPFHAFVGINIPVQNGDVAIEVDGLKYVLAEPVGPSLIPLGKVSDESLRELKKGLYSWRTVP